MIHYCTVYNTGTGEIVSCSNFSINDDPDAIARNYSVRARMYGEEGYHYLPVESIPVSQYVVILDGEPVVADKPTLHVAIDKMEIAADGEDVATLTGLPNPCTIIVDDDDPLTPTSIVEVTGGGFTFSTEDPGPYSFEVRGQVPVSTLEGRGDRNMTMTHITGTKNKALMWLEGENRIDAKAAAVRARFATPGLDGVYLQKREEAEKYLGQIADNQVPDLADYPYLTGEIGSTAPDAETLAALWIYMNQQFKIAGAFIEGIRTNAKIAVRAARSNAEIGVIVTAAIDQLDEIGPKPPPRPNKTSAPIQPVS